MVLHDLPTGAMRHLDRFLDEVAAAGGRIRQDFPPDCLPIVDGIAVQPLEPYVTVACRLVRIELNADELSGDWSSVMAFTMSGEVQLNATREAVYKKLNDPEVLKACIPGCEQLDMVSPTEFVASA